MKKKMRHQRGGGSAPAGLTLVELLLALTVTTLIGAGITSMLYFSNYANSKDDSARDLLAAAEFVTIRVADTIQQSRMVLARGDDYLVLWAADTNNNSAPELSELRRIDRSSYSDKLRLYKAPTGVSPDPTYSLASTDFNTVTDALRGSAQFPGQVWATASSWSTVLDNPTVQQANFVGWRLTLTSGNESQTLIGGAALRN